MSLEYRRKYYAAYRKQNAEELKAYRKRYYDKNKYLISKKARDYYIRNKEKIQVKIKERIENMKKNEPEKYATYRESERLRSARNHRIKTAVVTELPATLPADKAAELRERYGTLEQATNPLR